MYEEVGRENGYLFILVCIAVMVLMMGRGKNCHNYEMIECYGSYGK